MRGAPVGGEQGETASEGDAAGPAGDEGVPSETRVRTVSGARRVALRWSWARALFTKSRPAAIGPCRVTRPSRTANASCSAVMSLNPTNTFGPAARMASQSRESTMRCTP